MPPDLRLEFPLGQGLVGETARTRKFTVVHRQQPGVAAANASLEKLHPAYQTLAAFPVADDNFLYGVLILVDRADRSLTPTERQGVQLTCLMLAAHPAPGHRPGRGQKTHRRVVGALRSGQSPQLHRGVG